MVNDLATPHTDLIFLRSCILTNIFPCIEILTHALSHLSATDLATVALVSHRFHELVTTQHAWRAAFARFFPSSAVAYRSGATNNSSGAQAVSTDKREFTRLTTLATWRSEYIVRTRLLRSLARGKPTTFSPSSWKGNPNHAPEVKATVMYNSGMWTTVNHLHTNWGSGPTKTLPRFIHGADDIGTATISDPLSSKIENWGLTGPEFFPQFREDDRFLGHSMWGLGSGDIIGNPNVMDVSQPYGMLVGMGFPGGGVYFRHVEEQRGHILHQWLGLSDASEGFPSVNARKDGVSSVWMAKSASLPTLSEGLIGMLVGWHSGIVSAYSIGSNEFRSHRYKIGELTTAWVLSPGVPIIAIVVDDNYSLSRQAQNRIWAVALNALGEVFYLTKFPKRQQGDIRRGTKLTGEESERFAFATGRTVAWTLIESSRRIARPDPYGEMDVDGSYSPRSSWNGMCLSTDQVKAETREIEAFLRLPPKHFRKVCEGWDMRRKLEIDFAGDDENFAGEAMIVFECGLDDDSVALIKQYTRTKVEDELFSPRMADSIATIRPQRTPVQRDSLFGKPTERDDDGEARGRDTEPSQYSSVEPSPERAPLVEEWRLSRLTFGSSKNVQIMTTVLDQSTYANLLISEDPAFGMTTRSETSSEGSPIGGEYAKSSDLPGQRARFVAVGTKTGSIFVWNVRTPTSRATDVVQTIEPTRLIHTDSPEISCLAITALQLIHGGNDGLVQAWDILGSTMEPIRTLNSRFSSRARRRLVQAQASAHGVGINLFAAGAICLDPDPTMLRGMVSLGTYLRYWSYSSSATDPIKGNKRRMRRSERGSNQHGSEHFSATVRNANLKGYIASEQREMQRENENRQREKQRLAGRFGVGMLGNEDEAMAYAKMLSEESLAIDEERRRSQRVTPAIGTPALSSSDWSSGNSTPAEPSQFKSQERLDADIAEAIARSLDESRRDTPHDHSSIASPEPDAFDVPIRYARRGRRSPRSASSRSPPPTSVAESSESASKQQELADLNFALQLSLAEEASRQADQQEEFPSLGPADDTGKGKAKVV